MIHGPWTIIPSAAFLHLFETWRLEFSQSWISNFRAPRFVENSRIKSASFSTCLENPSYVSFLAEFSLHLWKNEECYKFLPFPPCSRIVSAILRREHPMKIIWASLAGLGVAKTKTECEACKRLQEGIERNLKKTKNQNFGGGNSKWEESRLG